MNTDVIIWCHKCGNRAPMSGNGLPEGWSRGPESFTFLCPRGENHEIFDLEDLEDEDEQDEVAEDLEDARYTLAELQAMPTLAVGQADDLKYEDGKCRVWLSRCGVEDGEPFDNKATIEYLIAGRWQEIEVYEAI